MSNATTVSVDGAAIRVGAVSASLVSTLRSALAIANRMRKCTCCGASVIWEALASIGLMDFGPGEPQLDLRNCACGSTLSAEVTL